MIECFCCHTELELTSAVCPVCGMPVLQIVSDDPSGAKIAESIASEIKKMKLGNIKINAFGHNHQKNGHKYEEIDMSAIPLLSPLEMPYGEIKWMGLKTGRIPTDETLYLNVDITRGGQIESKALPFKAPALEDFWDLGVMMTKGFKVKFLIGNASTYSETEAVSIL